MDTNLFACWRFLYQFFIKILHFNLKIKFSGILGLLDFAVRMIYNRLRNKDDETPPERNWINYFSSFMNFLMFVWFICGAYWVYSEYEPNTDPNLNEGLYCDDTLYSVAFWLITLVFIFLGILCIASIFAFCYFFVYKNRYEL